MPKTRIEWTAGNNGSQGYSINPVKGLCPMACPYCYARALYKRFHWNPEIHFDLNALDELRTVKKPSRFFIGSTFELFGPWVSKEWLNTILSFARAAERHTCIFLTKNPQRLAEFNPWPDNACVGTTIDREEFWVPRLTELAKVQAKVKWVSFEPLLEHMYPTSSSLQVAGVKWIVIGAQTGPEAVPPKREWVSSLIDFANLAKIPVFLKRNLNWPEPRQEYPKERK